MPKTCAAHHVYRASIPVDQAEIKLRIENELLRIRRETGIQSPDRRRLLVRRDAHEDQIGQQADALVAHIQVAHVPDVELLEDVGETYVNWNHLSRCAHISLESAEPEVERNPVDVPGRRLVGHLLSPWRSLAKGVFEPCRRS